MSEMTLDQDSADTEYAALLVGRTVTKVNGRTLQLDDGTVLDIVPNWGCGGCPSGGYEITTLNGCDNVITSARLHEHAYPGNYDGGAEDAHTYSLFVFADAQEINLLEIDGDDGNGYYGTGFRINVRRPTGESA